MSAPLLSSFFLFFISAHFWQVNSFEGILDCNSNGVNSQESLLLDSSKEWLLNITSNESLILIDTCGSDAEYQIDTVLQIYAWDVDDTPDTRQLIASNDDHNSQTCVEYATDADYLASAVNLTSVNANMMYAINITEYSNNYSNVSYYNLNIQCSSSTINTTTSANVTFPANEGILNCDDGQQGPFYLDSYKTWIINVSSAQDWIVIDTCDSFDTYYTDTEMHLYSWGGQSIGTLLAVNDATTLCYSAYDIYSSAVKQLSVASNTIYVLYIYDYADSYYSTDRYYINLRCSTSANENNTQPTTTFSYFEFWYYYDYCYYFLCSTTTTESPSPSPSTITTDLPTTSPSQGSSNSSSSSSTILGLDSVLFIVVVVVAILFIVLLFLCLMRRGNKSQQRPVVIPSSMNSSMPMQGTGVAVPGYGHVQPVHNSSMHQQNGMPMAMGMSMGPQNMYNTTTGMGTTPGMMMMNTNPNLAMNMQPVSGPGPGSMVPQPAVQMAFRAPVAPQNSYMVVDPATGRVIQMVNQGPAQAQAQHQMIQQHQQPVQPLPLPLPQPQLHTPGQGANNNHNSGGDALPVYAATINGDDAGEGVSVGPGPVRGQQPPLYTNSAVINDEQVRGQAQDDSQLVLPVVIDVVPVPVPVEVNNNNVSVAVSDQPQIAADEDSQ